MPFGGLGNDTLRGEGGNDRLYGGDGKLGWEVGSGTLFGVMSLTEGGFAQ
jgi:Ca2+-binding RTX toxin-like protein